MNLHSVTITVTGHAERTVAPNRCTVVLRVHADGPTRDHAAEPVTAAVATITELVTELREQSPSPVKRWVFDRVRHGRHRPYHRDGKTKPWVYTSSASITVTFHGFDAVGPFVERVAAVETVTVADLRWWVTRKAQRTRLARVRELAVRDARGKAETYAAALGCGTVRPVAVADPGMLGTRPSPSPGGGPVMRAAMMSSDAVAADESGPGLVFEPERITLTADVEARFEAV
ncbi:SIMPL domain-containing protein [Rhodococcus sp. Z13]|uniref:SIMPL domain-containing protein n=1 Tax=Rhodococcus sacchari TaxID=2962047 RepID=A0ACD4DB00_9NOCA|nr:SIMPL domain-containing protein [Rhodococcus sp. Z13]UYP17183.1 SIMPL domain-containing protein [Rhodococcus sp. Z13]